MVVLIAVSLRSSALPAHALLCFSCLTNFKKLLDTKEEVGSIRQRLRFIDGVRVAMILWVMLGGAYVYPQVDTLREYRNRLMSFEGHV